MRFRFGIASLLILTALVAVAVRLTHTPGAREITFDDLKFDTTQRPDSAKLVPTSIERFHKRKVQIRGFISPTSVFREKRIKQFVLTRDIHEPYSEMDDCDFILVKMEGSASIDFTVRPVTITGTFRLLTPPLGNGKKKLIYEISAMHAE